MTGLTLKWLGAGLGTALTAYFGGWDTTMRFLVIALIADYVTGVLAAWKMGTLDSDVMFWGGIRKAITLLVIGLCFQLDTLFGNAEPIYRTMAIYFYLIRELLSIVENTGKLGVKWPGGVTDRLAQLKQDKEDAKQ